jgi:hypothetical protein
VVDVLFRRGIQLSWRSLEGRMKPRENQVA